MSLSLQTSQDLSIVYQLRTISFVFREIITNCGNLDGSIRKKGRREKMEKKRDIWVEVKLRMTIRKRYDENV